MELALRTLLQDLEEQGNEFKESRQLAPLLVYFIAQQEEIFKKLEESLERFSKREFPKTDLAPVVEALEKLIKKEIKTQVLSFPDVQRVKMENDISIPDHSMSLASHEVLLRGILEAIQDLKNEEKTIVIENKMPVDRRPFALPVTGMGDAEFRKYKSRYRKVNVKPQETFDGSLTVFTLIHLPEVGTDECWVGGIKLTQDAGDYTLVGQKVTFTIAPTSQPYFNYDIM